MNKIINTTILVILIFCFTHTKSSAQTAGDRIIFAIEGTDSRFMIRQSSTFRMDPNNTDGFLRYIKNGTPFHKNVRPRSPIMLGVKLNPELRNFRTSDVKSMSKSFSCYIISDSTDAKVIALGITPDNIKDFRYHVVENDSIEIVPWSDICEMEQNYTADQPFTNLGTYNSPGKQVLVEVVNKKDYSIRDGILFDWRIDFTPKVWQIIVSTKRNYFNLNYAKLNRGYATHFDSKTGMPTDLAFPLDSINSFSFYFKNHATIPYQVTLKKIINKDTTSTQIDYWLLEDKYSFDSKHFNTPGEYELTIERVNATNRVKEEQKLQFKFQVLPPPLKEKSFSLMQFVYFGLGILILFSLLFLCYYLISKRKQKKIKQQKQLVDLKLKSIQSQLNPHFMFNALSSIQNLMNKNDIEEANLFLGKFSKLTRKVLDSENEEMVSLDDELMILEEYLCMEQLRFNFNFKIEIDEDINKANTEVPTMLLQPLIENAVKHGVSILNKKGMIRVIVAMKNKNLLLQVLDNGKGFSEEAINRNSLGIKLVKERIALLNQITEDQQIEFKIDSDKSGTTIVLNFKNWF